MRICTLVRKSCWR